MGNSWMAGPVAYAQELVDAFRWWLAEKAEWHLEHKAEGGPIILDMWCAALASDPRVQAAWPVVAEAINQVELWKANPKTRNPASLQPDASSAAFTKFFRDTVNDETAPDGIPSAVPWEELAKKNDGAQLEKPTVRGKLNVPRERFRSRGGSYLWAGASS